LVATEPSTYREVHQESDFKYHAERLCNMLLGCLINLDEENLVFLAHCIVQKYLESLRISEDATSYVRTGQEAMIKGCMRTVLQEAQAID